MTYDLLHLYKCLPLVQLCLQNPNSNMFWLLMHEITVLILCL